MWKSLKYLSNSLLFISYISNVEKPGVSAMYELQSILNNSTVVVVFLPFLFLLLISPSSVILSLKILFIKVDLPTPEFPENAVILFFKISSTTFIFSPIFAFVFITLYPIFYINFLFLRFFLLFLNLFYLYILLGLYLKILQMLTVYPKVINPA